MECRRGLVAVAFLFMFVWVGLSTVSAGYSFPTCEFPAIYNFGDSTADTGGIAATFDPFPELDRKKFIHSPKLAGRSSDGRLIIDFIAEHLKLSHLSAYLDSLRANFRHGANFATGGSTIRRPNASLHSAMSPFSLDVQILQFNRFKALSQQLYNQAKSASDRDRLPRPEDFVKALYTFDIGQNDIHFGFMMMSFDELLAELPDIINQFASAIENIYQQGGRAFWIHNTVPLGCLPGTILFNNRNQTPENIDEHGCVKSYNDLSLEFNRQLKERVIVLRTELPEAAITYVDVYAAKYALTSNAKNLGYVPFGFWYNVFGHNDFVWCGGNTTANYTEVYSPSCEDYVRYVSWDAGHYSDAANQWVANYIVNGSLSDPPIPITQACHRQPSRVDGNKVYGASISNVFTGEPKACSQFL